MMIALFLNRIPCIFKSLLNINCPTCGMTRAFLNLLEGNLLEALSYNILCIPCLIFFIYYISITLISIIKKDDNPLINFENRLCKHYKIIIIVLIINFIIKNI